MDDTLEPIIATGTLCIEPENWTLDLDSEYEPWKLVLLCLILLHYVYKMIGVINQRMLLNDESGMIEKYR